MVQETPERIQTTRIEDEMRVSYLDYAMSVIVSRALPDVRDGLKPVQRRILFGMQELGVGPNSALKKTARVVGEVMGKFHPHGDQAIYDTLVRMAQDFTMRYPLVTGQGNFGSVDGDPPAQMRYTEARLAPIASELLADLDRDTVDFQPNFDDSVNEPVVLPSRIPNLLLNGASGIAVGMATNVPPHNLNEICDALTLLIGRPEAGIDELMQHVQGPDFPTRGRIFGREAIRQAYASGRGKVTMQGVITHEQTEAGRIQLVVTELPYQVNKSTLIQRIADLVRNKRIEGISDLRDESDRDGMRIVIELSRAGTPAAVEAQLFKLTALQSTFAVNMLALVDGQPKTVSLKEALQAFIEHRREVIRRRSEFDLKKARERAEILEGLLRAIEHLDWVIATIRASESADAAKTALMAGPRSADADDDEQWLSERQAQAVLDMQLRRLAALERKRIEDEHAELAEQIAWLEDLLAHPEKIDGLIKDDCAELKETYGDERVTQAFAQPAGEISAEDLVPHQRIVVTVSDAGYMKRVPLETYRRQGRGGRGVTGAPTRDEDAANHLVVCDTHDSLLFFTQQGRVYSLRGYEAPEATRQARGIPLVNLVEMGATDRVTSVVVVSDFSRDSMVLATAGGDVKRTPLKQFESVRRAGLIAMNLKRGDSLIAAHAAADGHDAILVSSAGRAIRFAVGSLRVASRASGGVRGMRLGDGDRVVGLVIDSDGEDLLLVSERGVGKRTPIVEYPTKGRGGMGMLTFRTTDRSGPLAVARAVTAGQEIILVSREGIVMRTDPSDIRQLSRTAQGVAVMNIGEGDTLAALARIDLEDDRRRTPEPEPPPESEDDDDAPGAAIEAAAEAETEAEAEPATTRKAADIGDVPDAELRDALEAALPAGEWTAHDAVLRAASRTLRFARLSQGVSKALERAIHAAVVEGWIEENGESQELRRPAPERGPGARAMGLRDLSDLGEFGLIGRIIERLGEAAAHDILVPPGDDAAAWAHEGATTVATVDSLVEGTHWRRDTMSMADVGWRCAATSLSDLAAMGAEPGPLLMAAQLGPDVSLADLDAFVDGLAAACRCFGARIAGGNIARAANTSFSATAIGSARDGSALLRRDAARPGDAVAVSGAPGAAAAGLALIEAGRESEPEAAALIAAHRRPRARIALGRAASDAGLRCAIDISDGLLQDLGHVAVASGVAIEIEAAALSLHPAAVALLGGDRAFALALGGGEDYELALCGPAATLDALAADGASEAQLPPLTRIGRVVTGPPGEAIALDPSGRRIDPASTGWDQLR